MKSLINIVYLSLIIVHFSNAAEPSRTWTNLSGRKIEASLYQASESEVGLLLSNGTTARVPLTSLSADDVNYVKTWRKDEEARNEYFSLNIMRTSSGPVGTFLKRNSTGVQSLRGGKLESISVYTPTNSKIYEVEAKADHVLFEIIVQMVPPRTPGAAREFILHVDKLTLVFETRTGQKMKEKAGPRWQASAKSKMGKETAFALEGEKPIEFGVGFVIPNEAKVIALEYENTPISLYAPIR
ncbi:MAG: SHD1 domain-containing protein [Verrucomicrobiales bacterium]|nr:SHD1 domain-containing protein [Verrucomicrobiales bacterium]